MREHRAPSKLVQRVQALFGSQDDVFTAVAGKASAFISCHVNDVVVLTPHTLLAKSSFVQNLGRVLGMHHSLDETASDKYV